MSRGKSYAFFCKKKHNLLEHQNTSWRKKFVFFLQKVLMTVGDAMVINIPGGLPGIRDMGLAKQPRRPSNPVGQATPSAKQPRSPYPATPAHFRSVLQRRPQLVGLCSVPMLGVLCLNSGMRLSEGRLRNLSGHVAPAVSTLTGLVHTITWRNFAAMA